jgi:D-alanyl-D-alanine carboxypeptidase
MNGVQTPLSRRHLIGASLAFALAPSKATAQTSQSPFARIDRYLDRQATDADFAGVVVISRNGKAQFTRAHGFADRDHRVPNKPDTRFNVASIGKMFTSVAILRLVEQQRLTLGTRLASALPEYPDKAVAAKITIEQLLSHSSGLPNFEEGHYSPAAPDIERLAEWLPKFTQKPLDFQPGSAFGYSNTGYLVLGMIIEAVTSARFESYLESEVFRPLGMASTGYDRADRASLRRATGYWRSETEPGVWNNNMFISGVKGGPAGGAYSTAGDLIRFAEGMRSNRLIKKSTKDDAFEGRFDFRQERYGLGFSAATVNAQHIVGHSGGHYGAAGELLMLEPSGWNVAILSNCDVDAYWGIRATILDALAGPSSATAAYWETQRLISIALTKGADVARADHEARSHAPKPRISVIEVEAAKYTHRNRPELAQHLTKLAAIFGEP